MTGITNSKQERVTMIGLGSMGAAIARAFIMKGYKVTIWNRDASKAAALVTQGAVLATGIVEAITASPLVVVCVSDYKVTRKIFGTTDATAALNGRTLVQLSTGTPKEARELHTWAQQQGAVALNGDILAWPRQIGGDEATITISGPQDAFQQHATTLQSLAGTFSHLGEEPGASAVFFSAVMAYLAGNWIGFCHGALICENEGVPVDTFGNLIANISPILATESRHMGEVIQHNRFANPESTVKTTTDDLHLLVQHSEEAGISTELPKFAANIFQRTVDAGYGAEEHAAIIKVLRKQI
ncbi:NAD(P)-binding domain-containing protein [Chitinophaga filiformis]|uniref:NAD(P)-dependent oxidoreductase n=1 Tax=Chitinophaga filiformis TaxID=104663 RepID=UPI001F1A4A63|nr:NAD(P)-binding domain-containing protein [Chitinophaga filiformis]MCF6405477.1 NAD(P)-binding domain-containing protein [Chitinophaga filiformis]